MQGHHVSGTQQTKALKSYCSAISPVDLVSSPVFPVLGIQDGPGVQRWLPKPEGSILSDIKRYVPSFLLRVMHYTNPSVHLTVP